MSKEGYNGVYLSTISGCMYKVKDQEVTVIQFPEENTVFIGSAISFRDAQTCIDKGWWSKQDNDK